MGVSARRGSPSFRKTPLFGSRVAGLPDLDGLGLAVRGTAVLGDEPSVDVACSFEKNNWMEGGEVTALYGKDGLFLRNVSVDFPDSLDRRTGGAADRFADHGLRADPREGLALVRDLLPGCRASRSSLRLDLCRRRAGAKRVDRPRAAHGRGDCRHVHSRLARCTDRLLARRICGEPHHPHGPGDGLLPRSWRRRDPRAGHSGEPRPPPPDDVGRSVADRFLGRLETRDPLFPGEQDRSP